MVTAMIMGKDINCNNFIGLLEFLRRHYGEEGVSRAVIGLVGNEKYLILDKSNPSEPVPIQRHHLMDSAYWVSNDFSIALLANVKKIVNGPNPLFTAGKGAVLEHLSKSVLFLSRVAGPKFVSKQAPKVNARFNRTKEVKIQKLTGNSATLELHYHPNMKVTKDVCNWNLGIYAGIAQASGTDVIKSEETKCIVEGDENCEIHITWREASLIKRLLRWLMRYSIKDLITDYEVTVVERDKLIDTLTSSEKRYRTLTDSSLTGIYILQDGIFVFVNHCMANMLGYVPEELIGKKLREIVHPEDLYLVEINQTSGNIKPPAPSHDEFRTLRKDGTFIWLEVLSNTINYKDKPARMGNALDITEKKEAFDKRIKLEMQLQQAQKMESVGTLAGGVAHDFNNLLMGILGNISLMLLDIDSGHPHYEKLKNIEQYVKNGANLTKQILGFSRRGKYEVKVVDANDLLEKTSKMFGRTKKEIRIQPDFQKDLWTVEVDRNQIEQVLLNLYVNAWQAMPGGGILYLRSANINLDENQTKPFNLIPGKYVKISVTDTGTGMDEATQQRIFDPFFTTKEMGRGTGLGLASAYGIIKNHGGIINVQSKKGEGATFNIFLPESEGQVVPPDEKSPEPLLKGNETILLVDDEDMIIEVGSSILEALGYNVLLAKGGKEALEVYNQNPDIIDMVILDLVMPDMNGGEVFDRLRAINPAIKVLLSSGYSIDGQASSIIDRGCDGFIQKPFDLNYLSIKLREIIDRKKIM